MSWARQVLHVFLKDGRRLHWLIFATLAWATLATASAIWFSHDHTLVGRWDIGGSMRVGRGLLLLGACLVIQGDPATGSDAFWYTRPFSPSAVAVAKLLTLGLFFLAVPSIGQFVALRSHGLAPVEAVASAGYSALFAGSMVGLVGAAAALTKDVRSFIALIVGWLFAFEVLDTLGLRTGLQIWVPVWFEAQAPKALMAIVVVACVAVIAVQYSWRSLRVTAVVAVVAIIVLNMSAYQVRRPSNGSQRTTTFEREFPKATPSSETLLISDLEFRPTPYGSESYWSLVATVTLPNHEPDTEYWLGVPTTRVTWEGGSVSDPQVRRTVRLAPEAFPVGTDAKRIDGNSRSGSTANEAVLATVTEAEMESLRGKRATIELVGWLEKRAWQLFDRIPLEAAGTAASGATHIELTSVVRTEDGLVIAGTGERLVRMFEMVTPRYALYNEKRGELAWSWAKDLGFRGLHFLVLEGMVAARLDPQLTYEFTEDAEGSHVDHRWLDEAQLAVATARRSSAELVSFRVDGVKMPR